MFRHFSHALKEKYIDSGQHDQDDAQQKHCVPRDRLLQERVNVDANGQDD